MTVFVRRLPVLSMKDWQAYLDHEADMRSNKPWPEARVEEMLALVRQGLTAAEVGKRMDPPATRNAVLGKCKRLNEKVGRGRKVQPAAIEPPPERSASPLRLVPEIQANRRPLCSVPGCPYTKQPGRDWCHEHVPLPGRRRAEMRDIT